jgi:DNA-binding MarR family transcriptional regulator
MSLAPDDFDIESLDDVIHGRLRLGVMAFLSTAEKADFNALKGKLGATDGNLSAHLRKLEEAGYVRIDKRFVGKKPLTEAVLTDKGRAAFIRYLDAMRALVDQDRG